MVQARLSLENMMLRLNDISLRAGIDPADSNILVDIF